MSGGPVRRPATYDDLVALPDDVFGQIVDGELYATPRPAIDHQVVCSALEGELGLPFTKARGGPGGWWLLLAPEIHLDQHILVPDLVGWRRQRLPVPPRAAFISLPPDWVCEVLCPSTARLDRVRKLRVYAEQAVGYVWLVDPALETLEVFRSEGTGWDLALTAGGDEVVRAEPFDAIELELTHLWLRPA